VKLFDRLADALFREDSSGRTLFYPWGIFGPGFITEAEETRTFFRKFYRNFSIAMLVAIIAFQAFAGMLITVATILPIFIVWYYVTMRRLVKNLHRTPEKLGLLRFYQDMAKSRSWAALITLQLVTLFFTAGAAWTLQMDGAQLLTLLAIGMFGLGAIAIAYMIHTKRKLENAEPC
jgi:hypothetical protein